MATTQQEVVIKISTDSKQAEQSVGSYKKQLKEANQELVTMSMKFGTASKEAAAAAVKVAKLKDEIGDAKALADTFNPDKKFVALGGALQGVTAGFSTVSGLLGVLGEDSKETEKLLLKVQSAMALQQGISGIMGSIDAFKMLGNTIKTQVVSAFSTLKGAILATGLGALVVALGAVVYAFDQMSEAAERAAAAEEELKKQNDDLEASLAAGTLVALKNKKDLAIASAKTDEERFKQEQYYRRVSIMALQDGFNNINDKNSEQAQKIKQQIDDLNTEGQIAAINHTNSLQKISDDAAAKALEKQKEYNKKRTELQKELNDEVAKQQLSAIDYELRAEELKHEERMAQLRKFNLDVSSEILRHSNEVYNIQSKAVDKTNTEVAAKSVTGMQISANKMDQVTQQVIANKTNEAIVWKATEEEKIQVTQMAVSAMADLLGRDTAAGKALGIAQALINTYIGASEAIKEKSVLPQPFATIQKIASVAAIIATGMKTVKAITAVKVPGGASGGGGSVPSLGSISAPLSPTATTTTLDAASINGIGSAASRAYVLETDVSGNQERIKRLNRAARINTVIAILSILHLVN